MEPGTGAVIRRNPDGSTSVEIVRFRAGWSKAEVAEMLPGSPHTDTMTAHIERAGVKIGAVGRFPVLSEQQIQAVFGLGA